jgi:hypothetical protein
VKIALIQRAQSELADQELQTARESISARTSTQPSTPASSDQPA